MGSMSPGSPRRSILLARTGFEAETRDKAIRDTRLSAVVGSVLYLAFCVLDYFAYPGSFIVFLAIRCVVVLLNALIFVLMWTRSQA